MKLKCIKSLWHSIYNSHAFVEGREYVVLRVAAQYPHLIFVRDEKCHEFNLSLGANPPFYNADDYFEQVIQ